MKDKNGIDIEEITPIEKRGNLFFKREDKFEIFGVKGAKVRSAYMLIQQGLKKGYTQFITAGSRQSPQCEIVSNLCQKLGLINHVFMPEGSDTSVIKHLRKNDLTVLHRVKAGYNNVICARAKEYAEKEQQCYIPFGMECKENVDLTKLQVANIPDNIKRIVIPVGSGMSFIAVMNGLYWFDREDIQVLGVSVGKDPSNNIKKYLKAPTIKYSIIKSDYNYEDQAEITSINGVNLDPIYESKCIPYLKDGDLLWVVGKRIIDNQ